MYIVKAYDIYNNTHEFGVETKEAGREYAKRIITEGLWILKDDCEVFYPVHQVVKVKVIPVL
jgi:hypothetical protein